MERYYSVIAMNECAVMLLDYRKVLNTCSSACRYHKKLIENMLKLVARKNLILNQKIQVISQKTLRGKILCFLQLQSRGAGKFTIPYNREELANYICADRSAVSNELSRLQKEGILRYRKNEFEFSSEVISDSRTL